MTPMPVRMEATGGRMRAMALVLQAIILWLLTPSRALGLTFAAYHSQDEIRAFMERMATENPQLVKFQNLGYSDGGRSIDFVSITMGDVEEIPAIYINGTHHGDEKSSTEAALGLIEYLIKNKSEPLVRDLLSSYNLYIQPLVNPDGHASNNRFDANGVDPNRDYAFPGRTDDDAFKSIVIRLVRGLLWRVKFRAALALHSGMEGVLWAWAHSAEPPPDEDKFYTIAKLVARAMSLDQYRQSFSDYPSQGEFIDYAYMSHGTLAMTLEVSRSPSPPASELAGVVKKSVAGIMTFMLSVQDLDRGVLALSRNNSTSKGIIPWAKVQNQSRRSTH